MRFSIRTIWCVGFILSEMLGDWHINNLAEREEQRMKRRNSAPSTWPAPEGVHTNSAARAFSSILIQRLRCASMALAWKPFT
jgi:hypothetical protein